MLRIAILCLTIAAAGSVGQSLAQTDRSGVLPPNNRYCLVQRDTAAVNCMFATWQQCQESANVGREGQCIVNPALGPSDADPRGRR
jgi:hypothetical protein